MLIKLTGIPNPDINGGRSSPVYIDPTRVLLIEASITRPVKKGSGEAWRQAISSLHDEVLRVSAEAANPPSMVVDSEQSERAINSYMRTREAAAALNAAHGLVARSSIEAYHDEIACTCVSLACGTGLEHGVMLARVSVLESPEEIARLIGLDAVRAPAWWPTK